MFKLMLTLTSSVIDEVEDVDRLRLVTTGEQSGAGDAHSRALRRRGVNAAVETSTLVSYS